MINLKDKVAIVTGGGRGIGKAIALKLAEQGANIIINDINRENADTVVEEVKTLGQQSLSVIADVSSSDDVNKMVNTVKTTFGKIDILVNNAGITRDQLLLRMTDEDWDKVLTINLKSVFLCTRSVLRDMMKQHYGRIVNISSIVGIAGNPGQANYASAKAGIIGFTKTIAKEVASRGITINAVAPGFIDSDMTQRLPEAVKEELKKRIPMGKMGTAKDVADSVAFFASDEAAYITGQVLSIDGGMGGL